ncbi:dicarboxylate/amino acid:cation symporter [Mucilaginibacter sp. RS28]|uniref:Dicarboxylate/amino acid:cation symporter n=1 Tax=Mucilaginibacter straminoryzae TaxID=2932774 RepID=A0A9X1X2S0_9SPHI|nr:dicarboxylate/amino acid:cation symporter [Mucilaginibacter straminoryzae]MCJ8210192.1 dicarboxylate/amino acid:cation symporter [Mucilaginibacter straminoryzae]
MPNWIKNYSGMIWLLTGIIAGSVAGLFLNKELIMGVLKPIGDIFLNLLFVAVIPLVFFAVSSAIANLHGTKKLSRIMFIMSAVFVGTVIIAALLTIAGVSLFPVHMDKVVTLIPEEGKKTALGDQITSIFTTDQLYQLLSRKNMLALIIFSLLVGFGTLQSGEKGTAFTGFLNSANEVFKNMFIIIMKPAPIGLGAYFAVQVATFGPSLFGTYGKTLGVGYAVSIFYYLVFYSIYAFIAGGISGIKRYWKNNIIPSATAVGTCSSIATIPANLDAAKKMGISDTIASIVVPLGGTLHKDGSSVSSILKMAVVFAMFGRGFDSAETIIIALGVTVLVSIVEGGIPNGGYVGELLFISVYGLPPQALPPAIIIGTLIDPVATLLNATGDTAAALLVNRFVEGRNWLTTANQTD